MKLDITTLALKLDKYYDIETLMKKEHIDLSEEEIKKVKDKYFELKSNEHYVFGLS